MRDIPKPARQTTEIITVAVVEDNSALRQSLKEILNASPDMRCVAACANGEDALAQVPAVKPAVVFMDINLPGMTGVDCVRQLVERLPQTLVVMLTIQSNIDAVFASLQAGACGYLHKPVLATKLVAAVREVVGGGSPMSAGIARKVVQAFQALPKLPVPDAPPPAEEVLTDREREVLRLLAEGYAYKEIADKVEISYHTVHNHIRHIYEKLHVQSRGQAVAKFRSR